MCNYLGLYFLKVSLSWNCCSLYGQLVWLFLFIICIYSSFRKVKRVLLRLVDTSDEITNAENIFNLVSGNLVEYNIDPNSNFIVTDEGANVVAAFPSRYSAICACHTLNTILKRSIEPYKNRGRNQLDLIVLDPEVGEKVIQFKETIRQMKCVINCAKRSPAVYSMLTRPLTIDCETRWLSKLTMIESWLLLTIPASSCSIERDFSTLARTVTKERSSLDPDTVSDLLLYKSMKKAKFF